MVLPEPLVELDEIELDLHLGVAGQIVERHLVERVLGKGEVTAHDGAQAAAISAAALAAAAIAALAAARFDQRVQVLAGPERVFDGRCGRLCVPIHAQLLEGLHLGGLKWDKRREEKRWS